MQLILPLENDLELRQLEEQNATKLFSLINFNREHLGKWFPWVDKTKTVADSESYIQSTIEKFAKEKAPSFGIWSKGNLIGIVSLRYIDHTNNKTEISYWLSQEFQGKGIMTQAVKKMINYVLSTLKLHRIEIRTDESNQKSRAIPERLGFKEEGVMRDDSWIRDHYQSHVVYSLLSSEHKED